MMTCTLGRVDRYDGTTPRTKVTIPGQVERSAERYQTGQDDPHDGKRRTDRECHRTRIRGHHRSGGGMLLVQVKNDHEDGNDRNDQCVHTLALVPSTEFVDDIQ